MSPQPDTLLLTLQDRRYALDLHYGQQWTMTQTATLLTDVSQRKIRGRETDNEWIIRDVDAMAGVVEVCRVIPMPKDGDDSVFKTQPGDITFIEEL